jgi:hypothetical protein
MPGSEARPFADFQEIFDNLSPSQQTSAVGKSAYKLIQDGVVDFKDVVSPTHVLTLQEVVAEKKLTVKAMTEAGVRPDIAKAVRGRQHARRGAERAASAGPHREDPRAGVSDAQIRDMVGKAITERVAIGSGPSGTWSCRRPSRGCRPPCSSSSTATTSRPRGDRRPNPNPRPDEEE